MPPRERSASIAGVGDMDTSMLTGLCQSTSTSHRLWTNAQTDVGPSAGWRRIGASPVARLRSTVCHRTPAVRGRNSGPNSGDRNGSARCRSFGGDPTSHSDRARPDSGSSTPRPRQHSAPDHSSTSRPQQHSATRPQRRRPRRSGAVDRAARCYGPAPRGAGGGIRSPCRPCRPCRGRDRHRRRPTRAPACRRSAPRW